MINWDNIKKNKKLNIIMVIVLALIIITIIILYVRIGLKFYYSKKFTNSINEIVQKNNEPIFSVQKIYLCSSANVIDNSKNKQLDNLNVYQYTDIAIYINNKMSSEELSNKNTIKQLYIDNISLEASDTVGEKSLNYINLLKAGDRNSLNSNTNSDRIDFNVIYTNEQNESVNYDDPTFYTDCSNPITLKYVNNNIYTNYSVEKGNEATFDGTLLKKLGIKTDDIGCRIRFKINLVNNSDEYYNCWVNFQIPLDDIYRGTTIKSATTNGNKYNFFTY